MAILSDGRTSAEHMKEADEYVYPEEYWIINIPKDYKKGISESEDASFEKFAYSLFDKMYYRGNKPNTCFAARTVYINFIGKFSDAGFSTERLDLVGNDAEAFKSAIPSDSLISMWINAFVLDSKKTKEDLASELLRNVYEANDPRDYGDLSEEMEAYFNSVFFKDSDGGFRFRTKYYFS